MNDEQPDVELGRREPERAERRYVDALVALDAASARPDTVVAGLAAVEREIVRLNQAWSPGGPFSGRGLLARLATEIGRMLPWRRRALHGALLATINRQGDLIRALIDANHHFHSHVVWYGQTIGAFASTRSGDGVSAGGGEAVLAAVNALAANWRIEWDALQAREHRYAASNAALTKAYDELREVAALAQQGAISLRRTVEAMAAQSGPVAAPAAAAAATSPAPDPQGFAYVAFEDRYRGSTEDIRGRLQDYVQVFAGARNVVDVGCGRGELLDLFREHGIEARGIDINDEMVAICRSRGLTADRADVLEFLRGQPEGSLGGLVAIQVVEHLEPPHLVRVIDAAYRALKPDAPLVLETINAACWSAFFDSYIRDFTHARPLHPETMRYLVQAAGFRSVNIILRSPFAPEDKLPTVAVPPPASASATGSPSIADLAEALNAHAERLNVRLFTHRDYAIVARR